MKHTLILSALVLYACAGLDQRLRYYLDAAVNRDTQAEVQNKLGRPYETHPWTMVESPGTTIGIVAGP